MGNSINEKVREYWEKEPCGTGDEITKQKEDQSMEWFQSIEDYRYRVEPFIHSVAQFSRHCGEKVLEVGVGAGTDHLQWARVGCDLYGVDLTKSAINLTRKRLELYGFKSNLQIVDAENLPFDSNSFDVVYSWGVIHHSEYPDKIIKEIHRILKPEGIFIGMLYGRRSLAVLRLWIKHALLKGNIFISFKEIIWNHVESIGTKGYTKKEINEILKDFHKKETKQLVTESDLRRIPEFLHEFIPNIFGWFIAFKAQK